MMPKALCKNKFFSSWVPLEMVQGGENRERQSAIRSVDDCLMQATITCSSDPEVLKGD